MPLNVPPAESIARAVRELVAAEAATSGTRRPLYELVIGTAEKPLLEVVMDRCGWNQTHAAELLGINRNTLRTLLRKHGVPLHRGAPR